MGGRGELTEEAWSVVEEYILPCATYLLQMMDPQGVAEATAAFCSRHAIRVPED
jgi:hypothetical protein